MAAAAVVLALAAPEVAAQTLDDCVAQADDAARLACYDRLFRRPGGRAGAAAPAAGTGAVRADAAPPPPPGVSSALSTLWELGPSDKRGTFVVRTYLPNYLLPVHLTSNLNAQPASPTRLPPAREVHYRKLEAKLQVSLRAKIVEGLLLPEADLWFAYTQRSLWQVWNRQDSAPFRSTDYQPEAIYVVPVPARLGELPGGWRWRFVQAGVAHQSNGQSNPLSRSWNRLYVGGAVERGEFGLQLRANRRFEGTADDDNPDLTHFIGSTELLATWLPGPATAALTWRTNRRSLRQGSLQFDWTYPVSAAQPAGLRWYVQLFTGYGETLLDYNQRQASAALGVTLFQF